MEAKGHIKGNIKGHMLKAIAWMGGALLSFAVMAVSVRELSAGMHPFEMMFARSAIGLAIMTAVLSATGWRALRTSRIAGHLLRNVVHFTGQVLWIFGITLLPLATVFAIEFTTPMWGAVLAVAFLGERMNRGRWVALVLGFAGILTIVRPGLEGVSSGATIMLVCAVFFGATSVLTKWLTRTDQPIAIIFYMVVIQTLLGAVATTFVWTPVAAADWPWLGLMAVTGLTAHYCLTRALSVADASFVMPFDFLRLPLIAVAGYLLYGETVAPATFLGAALIFSGTYFSLRYESRR
ncbi:MAG: DMT family transporter [Kiloniellales bacterium]|nr:DMT family transporter [Kiloniellales bacterium]